MALFKKNPKTLKGDNPFEILKSVRSKGIQEVTFTFDKGDVKVWVEDDRVLAVNAEEFFPLNINSRVYWSQAIDDETIMALNKVDNLSFADEGFSAYVDAAPEIANLLAGYYVAKGISIMRWLSNKYKAGSYPLSVEVKESTDNLRLAKDGYKGAAYSTLTIDELEELSSIEDRAISESEKNLGFSHNDYDDVIYVALGNDFDSETPFPEDAENLMLSAAEKRVPLTKVRQISGGFLWSEVLEAIKNLEDRGTILLEGDNTSFFDQGLELAVSQGASDIETKISLENESEDAPELNLEDALALPEIDTQFANEDPLPIEDVFVEEDSENNSAEELLELDDIFKDVDAPSEDVRIVDVSSEDVRNIDDEPLLEETDSLEFEDSVPEPEAVQFFEDVFAEVEAGEPLPKTFDDRNVETPEINMAKIIAQMIPMAMKINKEREDKINGLSAILEENIEAERLLSVINADIDENIATYKRIQERTNLFSGKKNDKEKIDSSWKSIEALERDRSALVKSYLDNLTTVDDSLSGMKNMKEAKEEIQGRIQFLQDLENMAYYSPEEQTDDFGHEDDLIREAVDNGVFEKYSKTIEEEMTIEREASYPYAQEVSRKDVQKTQPDLSNAEIFNALAKERGLEGLFQK